MKQNFFTSKLWPFLCIILFTAFCNSQISGDSESKSKINSGVENQPRIDSILQFSVMITAMLEDSKGNFWIGSHGDGLCKFAASQNGLDGQNKKFTYYTVNDMLPKGIDREFAPGPDWSITRKINGGNQISSIQEDKEGLLWIKTQDNLLKFDGQTFVVVHPETESTLSVNLSNDAWEKAFDDMWIGGWDKLRVARYDGNKLEFLNFPPHYNSNRDGVSELYKDYDGNIWFGTMENGTFRYNGESFILINKADELGICRSIFQDNTGRIWITNNRFGLYYLEGNTLINFIEEYSLKNNDIDIIDDFKTGFQTIEQDQNGDIWFGTFGNGLWRYDGEKLFHLTGDNSFPIVTAKTIFKDKRDKLWFGLGEGSVYGFDGKSFYRIDGKEIN